MPKNDQGGDWGNWGETGYDPSPLTLDKMVGAAEVGYTREALDMANRLIASGLDQRLALMAVDQMMGMNSKTQAPPIPEKKNPQQEWDEYERAHPYMAAAKKQLVVGTRPLQDLGKAIVKPVDKSAGEKARAAKMLREYLESQDRRVLNEENTKGLWMLARMPGAPLAGQPVYGGPTPELNPPVGLNIGPATNFNPPLPSRDQAPLDVNIGPARINPSISARRPGKY